MDCYLSPVRVTERQHLILLGTRLHAVCDLHEERMAHRASRFPSDKETPLDASPKKIFKQFTYCIAKWTPGRHGVVVLPQSRRERNLVISGSIGSRSRKCIARGKECEDTEEHGVLRMRYLLGLLVTLIDTIDRVRYFPGPGSCA